jgi:hypothetical protein
MFLHVLKVGWQRDVVFGAQLKYFPTASTTCFSRAIAITKYSCAMFARIALQANAVRRNIDQLLGGRP